MSKYNKVHYNEYTNRFVLQNILDKKLYKIQPIYEIFIDNIIQDKVKEYINRFHFWEIIDNKIYSKKDIQNIISKIYLKYNEYNILSTYHIGIDLEKLLYNHFDCSKYCQYYTKSHYIQLMIDSTHLITIINYLIQSIEILSNYGIKHNDIRLANIIINPTKQELKEGIIYNSLPIIIDFGLSEITTIEAATKTNIKDLVRLFKTCCHGQLILNTNEPNWIESADTKSSNIIKQLEFLRTLKYNDDITYKYLYNNLIIKN